MSRQDDLPSREKLVKTFGIESSVYLFFWDRKGKDNKIVVRWAEMGRIYDKKAARTALRKLALKELINWSEQDNIFSVEIL